MQVFSWLNSNLLKMTWLDQLVQRLVVNVFGLDLGTPLGGSLHFYIYDVVKIFILLSVLIFTVSYIQSHFSPERARNILSRFNGLTANMLGALLGTLTPFCSCSSIPIFIGFTNAGLPLGVTFSFLVSSPLVDLASVILLASIFNWRIAFAYVVVGLILAVLAGTLISKMNPVKYIEPFVFHDNREGYKQEVMNIPERISFSLVELKYILKKVWIYVLVGVAIGAFIHNWIPESYVTAVLGEDKWYSVFLAVLVGVPMYADIFGTLPIAEALVLKGVGLGTALAFMMAVTALSLPSLLLLKNVVKTKLLVFFTSLVAGGILIIGILFNVFGHLLV